MREITVEEFNELIFDMNAGYSEWVFNGNRPCVLDFYATHCGPCKQMLPKLVEASEENPNIDFYKINVETEGNDIITALMGIQNAPSVFYIPMDGDPILTVGDVSKEQIDMFLNEIR